MGFDIAAPAANLDARGVGHNGKPYQPVMELAIERCPELALGLNLCLDRLNDMHDVGEPVELAYKYKVANKTAKELYDAIDDAVYRLNDDSPIRARLELAMTAAEEHIDWNSQ